MKTYCYCGLIPGYSDSFLPDSGAQHVMLRNLYKDAVIVEENAVPVDTGDGHTALEYRSALNWLVRELKSGDVVVFYRACLMGDDVEQGYQLYHALYLRGVEMVFLKEPHLNSSVYRECMEAVVPEGDDYVEVQVRVYAFEIIKRHLQTAFEGEPYQERAARIRAGIEKARKSGSEPGLKKGTVLHTKKEEECIPFIFTMSESFCGSLPDREVMLRLGISRNTLYKYKRIVRGQIEQEQRELEEERRKWEEEYGEIPSVYE